ncbi:MAG: hypothetical protein GY845_36525 [Planctomycetes bacterium]|nr:hypothetical protein [Planctomycetota bacterium]
MIFINGKSLSLNKILQHIIVVSLGVVFFFHLMIILYQPYLNHDVAQYLTAGQMLINGAVPYVDIIDTNPPMIIYISAVPAVISSITGMPLAVAGILFYFLIVISTMLLFGRMMTYVIPEITRHQKYLIYIHWIFVSLWTYQRTSFGQREQLIFLFLASFFLLRHARYKNINIPMILSVVISVLAFFSFAIKPMFILPVLVVEVIHMLAYRKYVNPVINIETPICIVLVVIYITHFYMIPGMDSFYDYWLDFMIRGYSTFEIGRIAVLKNFMKLPHIHIYVTTAIILCFLLIKMKEPLFLLASCCGWISLSSILIYTWQGKGWVYQLLPFYYAIFLGIILLIIKLQNLFFHNSNSYSLITLAIISICIAVISYPRPNQLILAPFMKKPFSFPNNQLTRIIEAKTSPNDSVLFLTSRMHPAFPNLTYTGRKYGGRFLCNYPLIFFFTNSSDYVPRKGWEADEKKFYDSLVEDIYTLKPKLVFINTRDNRLGTVPYFKTREYLKIKGFYSTFSVSYKFIEHVYSFEVHQLRE